MNKSVGVDGKTDGFGAQYQAKMSGFAISRHENKSYCHIPFKFMEHLDKTKETVKSMEDFTGLKSDNKCDFKKMSVQPFYSDVHDSDNPSKYYTNEVRKELFDMYSTTHKPEREICDIVIHARKGDADASNPRFTTNDRISSTAKVMSDTFPNEKICIFSEGKKEDFDFLNDKYTLHLNGDIKKSFHSMVTANRLVIADSSFSYTAGLINQNDVYYTNSNWWHKPLNHWKKIDISK